MNLAFIVDQVKVGRSAEGCLRSIREMMKLTLFDLTKIRLKGLKDTTGHGQNTSARWRTGVNTDFKAKRVGHHAPLYFRTSLNRLFVLTWVNVLDVF